MEPELKYGGSDLDTAFFDRKRRLGLSLVILMSLMAGDRGGDRPGPRGANGP